MNLQKLQKNKGFPGSETLRCSNLSWSMLCKSQSSTTGFVMLFAVTLSALLLSIALGVTNIAFRELKFGTSAKDTNEAFFAADIGAECAEYYDNSTRRVFADPSFVSMNCAGHAIDDVFYDNVNITWNFTVPNLGNEGQGCADVKVDKSKTREGVDNMSNLINIPITVITSNGYNVVDVGCTLVANSVVRQLQVTYDQ